MSAVRIAGALLLTAAGALLGFEAYLSVKRRERLLSALGAALGVMAEEISLLRTPLPELFAGLAARGPEETRTFFARLSAGDAGALGARWSECVSSLPLGGEEREVLRALALSLGRYDAASQCAQIEHTRAQLGRAGERVRAERDGRAKTYLGLGLSLGAMLAVILL